MHRSVRRRCPQPRTRGADVKDVGFILSDLLNLFAGVIGLNHERTFSCLGGLDRERKARLMRELLQKSRASALQPRLAVAVERYRKRRVHCQAAGAGLHVGITSTCSEEDSFRSRKNPLWPLAKFARAVSPA